MTSLNVLQGEWSEEELARLKDVFEPQEDPKEAIRIVAAQFPGRWTVGCCVCSEPLPPLCFFGHIPTVGIRVFFYVAWKVSLRLFFFFFFH